MYWFLIGALLPIPFYILARRYPTSFWRYVNIPVCFAGLAVLPPATGINFASFFVVGAIFQWFIRRRHFRWWMRYNYLLSSGLDAGVIIAMVIIFFCLQFPKDGTIGANSIQKWWGNTVYQNTADWASTPLLTPTGPNGTFGPATWG